MAEYIERAAAVKSVLRMRRPENSVAQNRMLSIIQMDMLKLPAADVVEVVRCKDCKYNSGTKKCLHPDSFLRCRRTTISAPTVRERTEVRSSVLLDIHPRFTNGGPRIYRRCSILLLLDKEAGH